MTAIYDLRKIQNTRRNAMGLKAFPEDVHIVGIHDLVGLLRSANLDHFGTVRVFYHDTKDSKAKTRIFNRHMHSPKAASSTADIKGGWVEITAEKYVNIDAYIGTTSIVMEFASIGASHLYRNTIVRGKATIGDGSTISSGARIFGNASISNSTIGDESVVSSGTITNSKLKRTDISGNEIGIKNATLTNVSVTSNGKLTVRNLSLDTCAIDGKGTLAAPLSTKRFHMLRPTIQGTTFSGDIHLLIADFVSARRKA